MCHGSKAIKYVLNVKNWYFRPKIEFHGPLHSFWLSVDRYYVWELSNIAKHYSTPKALIYIFS